MRNSKIVYFIWLVSAACRVAVFGKPCLGELVGVKEVIGAMEEKHKKADLNCLQRLPTMQLRPIFPSSIQKNVCAIPCL